ncbi:DUF6622 family protein [Billgrantia kenyensis]|uniref:DUF1453 domain-containing protein n=1 Tax=Billgrantia kenyensis TaxID=321266 RepID=A0A7V9W4N5_9GAMM|nr:DUF6622 family protein [Halomonas kenyensis]MBA2781008.1 hypothetical protein [Halomonas kenyensis]MCG6663735.1 hypothetical protein [Halomonas kenyensis]
MLLEIITNTPLWVWPLLLFLLHRGYQQSKPRNIGPSKLGIIPAIFLFLGAFGLIHAFGFHPLNLALWGLGIGLSVLLHFKLELPRGVSYSPEEHCFRVPGSWQPLTLMLAVFCAKFSVGVMLGMQLAVVDTAAFAATVSLAYGLLGGMFLGRAVVIWQSAKLWAKPAP